MGKQGIENLLGKTLVKIKLDSNMRNIYFETSDGKAYNMFHSQDCCEDVSIADVCGDLDDLIGSEILVAERVTSNKDPKHDPDRDSGHDSFTWTFFKLSTVNANVTIRWYGTSNGYYGEDAEVEECSIEN